MSQILILLKLMKDRINFILHFIRRKLIYPFKEDILFFLLLWVIISFPNCYSQKGSYTYVIYLSLMYYILTYLICFLLNINLRIAKALKPILFIFTIILSLLNFYCLITFGCLLSNDLVQIIAGTNTNEAKEFFNTYISWRDIVLFLLTIIICSFIGFYLPHKYKKKRRHFWIIPSILLIISIGAITHNSGIIKEEFINKQRWNFSFDEVVDLRNHLAHPSIIESDSIHPEQIVIIIGESFSRNHSSLYGYNKSTNPLLLKKVENGNLIVFKNVTSPSTHTISAFKYILNTCMIVNNNEKPWYDYTNIIEVFNNVGYHTLWISNQAKKGMFDNIPSSYSKLCDESYFLEDKIGSDRYDERLLGTIDTTSTTSIKKRFTLFHLMGQHADFSKRYPSKYEHFKVQDYNTYPEHQRYVLASYDNATLYNDFVVNSIIEFYKKEDAIVFYFSDHALDIFDTDPDYFGHAKMTDLSKEQAKKIPFMVYCTPSFVKNHNDKVEKMKKASEKSFCTDKFIFFVMDIAGYKFTDNDNVKRYSLIN